jgi:hypothetical protein
MRRCGLQRPVPPGCSPHYGARARRCPRVRTGAAKEWPTWPRAGPACRSRHSSPLPAEVWLDAAGLARRISVNSESAAAPDAQVWSIVEVWDFGVAAAITLPGPHEVLTGTSRGPSTWPKRTRPGRIPDPACAPPLVSAPMRRCTRHCSAERQPVGWAKAVHRCRLPVPFASRPATSHHFWCRIPDKSGTKVTKTDGQSLKWSELMGCGLTQTVLSPRRSRWPGRRGSPGCRRR